MTRNLRRSLVATSVLLLSVPGAALAQQPTTVSGRVTAGGGAPLQAVVVSIPTLSLGANTDAEGRYSFTVPATASGRTVVLTARRLGYQPQSVQITITGAPVTHDFALGAAAQQLQGIVVTALGIERTRKALGVAQQTVDSSMLTDNARPTNLVSALSGKIAGINVTSATTQGGSARVVIRGANSIAGNNEPLFIVDGIPIDNSNVTNSTQQRGYGGMDYGNAAQDINPDDIASLSILKGPNAAALYGSRAANGAIIITTKSGKGGRGFSVNASQQVTFESPLRLPKYQNQWGQGFFGDICNVWRQGKTHFNAGDPTGGFATFDYSTCGFSYVDGNYGGENDGVDESWGPALDGTPRSQFSLTEAGAAEVRPWVAHPNNVKNYFDLGKTFVTNVAAQATTDRANVRLSVTNQDVAGMVPNNQLKRVSASLNAGANVSGKFSTTGTIQYIANQGVNRPGTGYDEGNPMMGFVWFGRQVDADALRDRTRDVNGNQISWNYSYHNNPYFWPKENANRDQRDRVIGVASATYKFAPWISLSLRSGTDFYRDYRRFQIADGWIGGFSGGNAGTNFSQGGFNEQNIGSQETNTDFLVTATRNVLQNVGVTVNVGGNQRRNSFRTQAMGTDQLVVPGIYHIGNSAKPVNPVELFQQKRINSAYGQAEFAYADYAFVTVTGRNDWSSTLPKGNNSYFYPSVSGSFVFTQAVPMLGFNGMINYGKLRGGWSRVGNDADPYRLLATYPANTQFGTIPRFSVPDTLYNANLKPENTDAWEIGTELQMLDGRLTADLTYYTKRTSNQILAAEISKAAGFNSAILNAGIISNKGFEAQVTVIPLRLTNGFEWETSINYGRNKNKVEELYGDLQSVRLGPDHWFLTVEARKGYPYGAMFGVGFLRDDATGKIMLREGIPVPESSSDKHVLGSYMPDWTGGINSTFRYKGVDFGFLIDTRQGGNIYSTGNMWGMYAGILQGTEFRPDSGLLIDGIDIETGLQNTTHVRTEDYFHSLYQIQERWIYDASFVKLREARLGFELPRTIANQMRVTNARMSIVGRNLYLWAKAPNIDPEAAFSSSNLQGIEMGQLPTARSVGFQVTLTP
jgi:TonB-linked SusC/RagA family outer membrane protein